MPIKQCILIKKYFPFNVSINENQLMLSLIVSLPPPSSEALEGFQNAHTIIGRTFKYQFIHRVESL